MKSGFPSAEEVIARLGLQPHPEGGHYRETFRQLGEGGARGAVSVIYYLLRAGEQSAWHRIDATEIWHHYAGAPLEITIRPGAGRSRKHICGCDFALGQEAHVAVPAGAWQTARPLGNWSLAGCTVAPAFTFDGFELASTPEPGRGPH